MKFAFLILAHEDPDHLRRLIHALDDPHFDFFVHVDRKADLDSFRFGSYQLQHSTLTVLENRITTYWGDMSLVDAMLAMYRRAYETQNYDRYITLSGLDYPLVSNQEIYDSLSDLTGNISRPGPWGGIWTSKSGVSTSGSTICWPGLPCTR